MNELLGWYGYGNVDRNELSKCPKNNSTSSMQPDETSSTQNVKLMGGTTAPPSSRTTNSTPERYNNNSSPESNSRSSKSPNNSEKKSIDKQDVECGWCKRPCSLTSPEFLATPEGPRYCTESCFSQSRRASFKRAKTCDWCKHVRHAVSYVDFQDGASQLQFCSDKCLNQYKMQIFCKETQAHLDMNPHLKEKGCGNDGGLITPDLWLRNCKSPSTSPSSERSRSRSPLQIKQRVATLPIVQPHKPLITVAPTSKLLSRPMNQMPSMRLSPKSARKRRSIRICGSAISSEQCSRNTDHSNNGGQPLTTIQDLTINAQHKNIIPPTKESLSKTNMPHHFLPPPPNLYPLRHNLLQAGVQPRFIQASHSHHQQQQQQHQQHQQQHQQQQQHHQQLQQHLQQPMPSVHLASALSAAPQVTPVQQLPCLQPHQTPPPTSPQTSQPDQQTRLFGANSPPITILVPYPIIMPIPIPIPIPMPLVEFIRAAQYKLDMDKNNINKSTTHNNNNNNNNTNNIDKSNSNSAEANLKLSTDEPLDFTKSKETTNAADAIKSPSPALQQDNVAAKDNQEIIITTSTDSDLSQVESPQKTCTSVNSIADDDENIQKQQQQRLPKFKITRLNSKRIITASTTSVTDSTSTNARESPSSNTVNNTVANAKESLETSRPLRKRKRVVDCDYLRLKDDEKRK